MKFSPPSLSLKLYQILTIIESVPIRVGVGQAGCRLISYANDRAFHPAFRNGALATFCYNNALNNHNLLQPEFDSSRRDKVPRIFQSCNPRILLLRWCIPCNLVEHLIAFINSYQGCKEATELLALSSSSEELGKLNGKLRQAGI